MRDPKQLQAFHAADELALLVCRTTRTFPQEERFALAQQLRRAAVSCASNIVEGCARTTQAEYVHFLDMAYGSSCEVQYQITLADRLGYLDNAMSTQLADLSSRTCKLLNGLIRSYRRPQNPESS